jgi:hypothetical protein
MSSSSSPSIRVTNAEADRKWLLGDAEAERSDLLRESLKHCIEGPADVFLPFSAAAIDAWLARSARDTARGNSFLLLSVLLETSKVCACPPGQCVCYDCHLHGTYAHHCLCVCVFTDLYYVLTRSYSNRCLPHQTFWRARTCLCSLRTFCAPACTPWAALLARRRHDPEPSDSSSQTNTSTCSLPWPRPPASTVSTSAPARTSASCCLACRRPLAPPSRAATLRMTAASAACTSTRLGPACW